MLKGTRLNAVYKIHTYQSKRHFLPRNLVSGLKEIITTIEVLMNVFGNPVFHTDDRNKTFRILKSSAAVATHFLDSFSPVMV